MSVEIPGKNHEVMCGFFTKKNHEKNPGYLEDFLKQHNKKCCFIWAEQITLGSFQFNKLLFSY